MTSSAERKFVNLRKRLDQLGYRQPLGIESLPLVEKLFSDLVHTTESLRNAKLSAGKTEKESRNCDALLEPYRTENARLVRENNELHLEVLKLKEEKDHVTRELKTHIRKLDHETSDLKFLNNQYVHKVRCLEKDSKAKAERIQQLQEKNMQAVVQTPGGKKRSIPFRRQRMQIDELVPPSSTSAYPVLQPDDPYVADLLQLADGRIHELQEDIIKIKLDLETAQEFIEHLNTQVEERDKEIERLKHALHGGRPHDVISLEAQNISNEKLISHLNLQIEYLQETNRTLEEKIEGLQQKKKDVSTEVANLSLKNLELCEELTHIDDLAKRLEMDKERVLETADMELQETKKEIQRQQKIIEDLEDIITKIRMQSEGDFEKDRLRDQLVEIREQNEKLEGLVNFLEDEKTRLQHKVEKLMASEKDVVLELETMRAKHGVCGRERSPSRLDAFVKSLEEERDYYRQEVERYKRARGAVSPTRSPAKGRSPASKTIRGGVAEPELFHLIKERDELKAALLDFEQHMEDIQNNVKALSNERDHFKTLFKQAQDDLKLARTNDMSAEVSKLQEELKRTEVKIELLSTERDALMDRLKVAQTSALTNRQEEEQRIIDLENAVRTLERERLDLQSQVCLLKESRQTAEEELKVRSTALVHNAEEVAQQRAEANALRLLQEQMEQSLSDTQHRLSVKMNELHVAYDHIEKLEERIVCLPGELSQQSSKHKEEVAVLQKSVSALDREKDALQDEVDQKTEKLVALQEELSKKEKTLEDVRLTVTNMDKSLAQLQGALNSREREINSLRRQVDASQDELAGLRRDKEITIRENRRLQDDLATMTRENQAVHVEMEEALHEKDELKLRVHSYISEVSRIEKLMATKEQENRDLLDRFRMAHSEMEERDEKLQQAEGLNNSIRLELLSSDTERRHLRDTVGQQEREIQQHMQALQAYEAQVSSLVRGMSRLEEELHKAQEENASLLSDLASVRELCVKLDTGKELAAHQLTSKSMDLERVTGELEDVQSEAEVLKKQLASERLTVRNLETLLSTNRQKEFQTHLTASERESELKVLRDRLILADSKTAEHAREVSQLRGKVSQLQTEMDILKRQLTSERFERERAVQEMRRQGLSFSSLRSTSPLNISSSPYHISPERSILRTIDRSSDKSADRSVSFKD
ncbi:centrosomal protein of 135 kDa isoform X2 [Parambassis ranga]|uniref:Centrosomal protein of 135 kDa isoform X2 n=1 Tax=Parambassis ranga TaxID=210632 RepID=A0A6P7I3J6_9TELE|nr:centrosomal protein of 135 kDa isoform X2 [Parambassis ranga]